MENKEAKDNKKVGWWEYRCRYRYGCWECAAQYAGRKLSTKNGQGARSEKESITLPPGLLCWSSRLQANETDRRKGTEKRSCLEVQVQSGRRSSGCRSDIANGDSAGEVVPSCGSGTRLAAAKQSRTPNCCSDLCPTHRPRRG